MALCRQPIDLAGPIMKVAVGPVRERKPQVPFGQGDAYDIGRGMHGNGCMGREKKAHDSDALIFEFDLRLDAASPVMVSVLVHSSPFDSNGLVRQILFPGVYPSRTYISGSIFPRGEHFTAGKYAKEPHRNMKCVHQHDHHGFERTLDVVGDKWTMELLHQLVPGNNRFGLLHRTMKGISPKTLSFRLRQLEIQGIITRKVFAELPPHVEYSLTPRGRSLQKVIQAMDEWGRAFQDPMEAVLASDEF
jgi:DNA-binding HxlR family transcriptional regulator